MKNLPLFVASTLLCGHSAALLAQSAPKTCTAGQLDTTFGTAGTGHVQISPTLAPFQGAINVEGLVFDSTGASFTVSEAAIDDSGSSIPDLVKVKHGGARDLTFGGFGSIVPPQPLAGAIDAALAMDSAGNLLVAMYTGDNTNVLVSRYSPAGVMDMTYGVSGVATVPISGVTGPWAIRAAADGSVFIAASGFPSAGQRRSPVVAKLTPSGALDTSFGLGGYSFFYKGAFGPTGKATDLVIQGNGTILVGGRVGDNQTFNQFFVARLLATGVLDTSFGTSAGMTVVDFGTVFAYGRRLALQSDGKIVLVGTITTMAATTVTSFVGDSGLIRLNPNGSLDTSFNTTGSLRLIGGGGATGVALQHNNNILITGLRFLNPAQTLIGATVMRLTTTGQLDSAFGSDHNGVVPIPVPGYPQSFSNVIDTLGGKILVRVYGTDATGTNAVENLVRLDSGSGDDCL